MATTDSSIAAVIGVRIGPGCIEHPRMFARPSSRAAEDHLRAQRFGQRVALRLDQIAGDDREALLRQGGYDSGADTARAAGDDGASAREFGHDDRNLSAGCARFLLIQHRASGRHM
ncbi:hypothetical protein [Nocardia rhizosphaerihabitans]|uniref:hypothetical protein n=1 Tax=Nocardia rhizosphaerihabitans TaxID=1691570 RepID=UPI001E4E25DB|nr:hypothetical protein [Nocardia rhizosphaerihabitans]